MHKSDNSDKSDKSDNSDKSDKSVKSGFHVAAISLYFCVPNAWATNGIAVRWMLPLQQGEPSCLRVYLQTTTSG